MGKEIVINAQKDQMRIAIVEDGELAEMYFEDPNNERTLGDIHLGRVRRIMPSIKAAFVDVGQSSDAFLHFSDIADNIGDLLKLVDMKQPDVSEVDLSDNTRAARRHRPRAPMGSPVSLTNEEDDEEEEAVLENRKPARKSRSGKSSGSRDFRPESILKRDQKILVKIVKEPISAKGSRVSTDISLAGRFLVLVPLADYVAVSKKIVSYKERRRLRALATSLLPKGFGLIVRTVAEGKDAKTLDTDLRLLIDKWRRIEKRMFEVKDPPALMHQDVNMVSSVIRDLFSDDYDRILVDDQKVYRNIKGYIQAVAPQMAPNVQMHTDRIPVFKAAKIDRAVGLAFESRVPLPTGGYLIIEHTEAMHVVDVNSGRAGKGLSQEANSLKVNLESARMIAQQLRIRDLGGIIVVDFIDLRDEKNRRKVFDELRREFTKDRAVTKVLPMSDFGVVQITRQRLRPSITTKKSTADAMKGLASSEDSFAESAADALGVDQTEAPRRRDKQAVTPEEMMAKIDKWLTRHKENGNSGPLVLTVHPFARAFLQRGIFNASRKWFAKYFIRIRIDEDATLAPMVFRIFDAKTNEELTRKKRSDRRRGKGKSDSDAETSAKDKQATESVEGKRQSTRGKAGTSARERSSEETGGDKRRGQKRDQSERGERQQSSGRKGGQSAEKSGQQRSRPSETKAGEKSTRGRRSNRSSRNPEASGDENVDASTRNENPRSERSGRNSRGRSRGGRRGSEERDSSEQTDSDATSSQGASSRDASSKTETSGRSDSRRSNSRSGGSRSSSSRSGDSRSGDSRSGESKRADSKSPTAERRDETEGDSNRQDSNDNAGSDRNERGQSRGRGRGRSRGDKPVDTINARSDEPSETSSESRPTPSRSKRVDKRTDRDAPADVGDGQSGATESGRAVKRTPKAKPEGAAEHADVPSKPETVLFVSRHDPEPASTPASKPAAKRAAKPAAKTEAPAPLRTEPPVSTERKAPPKLYTSQHAPRDDSRGDADAH